MSGHSKWSQIKRQKGVADVKKGQTFTKLANAIIIAVKTGGSEDPKANLKLQLAIDQAKAHDMPKDIIKRAIERGLGKGGGVIMEELVYEGFGPGGISILVEASTESKNRTVSEIKNIFERGGGNFAGPGAVLWQFAKEGLILVKLSGRTAEEVIFKAADLGAQDALEVADGVEIYTKPEELSQIKQRLQDAGFKIVSFEISAKPQNIMVLEDPEIARKALDLLERLDAHDDVQKIYSNLDISAEVLKQIK